MHFFWVSARVMKLLMTFISISMFSAVHNTQLTYPRFLSIWLILWLTQHCLSFYNACQTEECHEVHIGLHSSETVIALSQVSYVSLQVSPPPICPIPYTKLQMLWTCFGKHNRDACINVPHEPMSVSSLFQYKPLWNILISINLQQTLSKLLVLVGQIKLEPLGQPRNTSFPDERRVPHMSKELSLVFPTHQCA